MCWLPRRWMGKGVSKAVANVNNDIAPALLVSCCLYCLTVSASSHYNFCCR